MFVCCWGLNCCCCLWSLNENMKNMSFWWKMNLMMIFDMKWGYESMFVSVLIAFWCMLTNNKVWGTNLGQRGSKSEFWVKNWMDSREETQNMGAHVWCNSLGEWLLAVATCPWQNPWFWASWAVGGRSGLS